MTSGDRRFGPSDGVALLLAAIVVVSLFFVFRPNRANRQLTDRPPDAVAADAIDDLYDPVDAGETLPEGFRQLLRRDGIAPVYEPEFVEAAAASWPADTLVIGVAIDGEAHAYPVDFLNRREMVIDSVAGIPVLVTW